MRKLLIAMLLSMSVAGSAFAQALPATITKSFSPSTVVLNGSSIGTITVTNPNAALPLTNVQFSDTMPAGIDLITQTGGTCSTPATGGGMFTINPGTEFFSSTSSVLAGGQSCTITVSVRGRVIGSHVNTTSTVTASNASPGTAASGTLTVTAPPVAATITKAFSPSTVVLNGSSIATITVTNPNAFSITNVQFNDTMPAGIDLITQTGGTCSTPATGGGMFSINPGTETFSSTSSVLTAGQSCTITVSVRGIAVGARTASQVASSGRSGRCCGVRRSQNKAATNTVLTASPIRARSISR